MAQSIPPAIIRSRVSLDDAVATYRLLSGDTEIGTVTQHADGHSTITLLNGAQHHIEPRRYCRNSLMATLRSKRGRK